MATLGMGDPPAVEPSIARHLNPAQGGLLAPPKPVLPSKMDRFSASVYQAAYKSSAVAVRALNVSSLLSAYQVENLDDLGQQLDKGSPSPTLWKEILMVNDLVLCNARQAVQASGRAMALSVVGERALWLNLSGLPDSEKRRIAGAPVEPGQALFGPAVAMMQQRRLLRIHSSSFRALTQPEDVLSGCGGRTRSAESSGAQNPDVHRRLADHSRFERGSDTKHCPCARSHHSARLQSEREQEQPHSFAECDFSGAGAELNHNARAAFATAHSLPSELPLAFQRRGEGTVSHMSQTTGSYGLGGPCPAFRPSENEGVHEVGFISSSQPITRSLPLCLGDAHMHGSAARLGECGVLLSGNSPWGNHDAQSCDDRCLLNRMGCHTGGQNSERCVAKHTSLSPHKLFGALRCLESSESLSTPPARASRAGALRQHHSRGLYQSPRGNALFETPCPSSQAVSMEQATLSVITGDSCPRQSEQRRRPSVEGEPTLWGMAPPPSDSGATVEEIRSGNCRSLRLARKRPVPYVLLATGRGRPPRRGRTGPSMAQCASLRISSAIVNSAHPGQGERTEPHSHSDSTQMAQISMAGTDSSSSVCTAVATPATHGPPVSSERGDLPSPPRQGGSLGLARERANLNTLGLPPRVVATIQNARASSTRSLYNCKWRVFEQWCDERLLISYQCSLTAVLSFLQDLIDGGRSFSTIKVYLAAIAACHVGFDGTTVGQHPLIRRFMKGARRSLPVIKRVIPEWDLSMVLEVLSQNPFEPLGDISLKLLSLKTALLLALASAKRVSDLHALSVHSSCMKFSISGDKVLLRPNPAFMPKCFPAFACEVIQLSAFHPPPFSSSEDKRLNALCPVRSLRVYIDRTSAFRRSDQLFISFSLIGLWKPSPWHINLRECVLQRASELTPLEAWQWSNSAYSFHPFMTGIHAHCGGLILGDVLSTASPGDRPLAYRASLWVYWATGELSISPIGGSRTRDDEREQ
ncbi:hypothetical protein H4Q32_007626 [Labeo rohita]|uniref:Uncharacterized protein n=1 Tax=Labeo rohita TaxID=84645 RepID=A0ABQ8MH53_LABRO|nr:hypothetical protein H4Q32_007626 [Labeo rohita]